MLLGIYTMFEYLRKSHTSILTLSLLIPCILFFIIYQIILVLNDGTFVYTIDDSYIHLALAENIAKGHYGLNLQEYSAPSSSILWPYLLAFFMLIIDSSLIPLYLNLFFLITSILLVYIILKRLFIDEKDKNHLLLILLPFTFIFINGLGLTFLGMEHLLQTALAISTVLLLMKTHYEKKVPYIFLPVLLLGVMTRYEFTIIAAPVLLYLLMSGYRIYAITSGLIIALVVLAFSFYLTTLGLGYFPTSVLTKSHMIFPKDSLLAFIGRVLFNIIYFKGMIMCLCAIWVGRSIKNKTIPTNMWPLAAALIFSIILQVLFGLVFMYSRYEVFIFIFVVLMTLWLKKEACLAFIRIKMLSKMGRVILLSGLLLANVDFLITGSIFPTIGSNNIYEQQFQMHRFATEYYKKNVAINDLGLVSYKNDAYVLDLGGLANREAFELRLKEIPKYSLFFVNAKLKNKQWAEDLLVKYNIELAMIYETWAPLPNNWNKVAELHLSGIKISPARSVVSFYVLDTSKEKAIIELKKFRSSLPEKVRLEIFEQ